MYLENLIISARERYISKFNRSLQLKQYSFIRDTKKSFKSLFAIIYRAYSAQKYVFAQLLGFTSSFIYDLILPYRWVCRGWICGVAREIRKVLKRSKGKMFEKAMQTARAEAYLWLSEGV